MIPATIGENRRAERLANLRGGSAILHSFTELPPCCGGASCGEVSDLELLPVGNRFKLPSMLQTGLTRVARFALDSAFHSCLPEGLGSFIGTGTHPAL
jgi:hypothetical protein